MKRFVGGPTIESNRWASPGAPRVTVHKTYKRDSCYFIVCVYIRTSFQISNLTGCKWVCVFASVFMCVRACQMCVCCIERERERERENLSISTRKQCRTMQYWICAGFAKQWPHLIKLPTIYSKAFLNYSIAYDLHKRRAELIMNWNNVSGSTIK
jgi:hypothetical protein